MPIWGRRASDPPAQEAHESQAEEQDARETQTTAGQTPAEDAAPAFWRAQGRTEGSPAEVPEPTVAVAHEPIVAPSQP